MDNIYSIKLDQDEEGLLTAVRNLAALAESDRWVAIVNEDDEPLVVAYVHPANVKKTITALRMYDALKYIDMKGV